MLTLQPCCNKVISTIKALSVWRYDSFLNSLLYVYVFCKYNGNLNKSIIRLYWFVVLQSQYIRSPISSQILYSIRSTLLRSNRGEMLSNILKRVDKDVCFKLANGETPRSFSSFASLFNCFFCCISSKTLSVATLLNFKSFVNVAQGLLYAFPCFFKLKTWYILRYIFHSRSSIG